MDTTKCTPEPFAAKGKRSTATLPLRVWVRCGLFFKQHLSITSATPPHSRQTLPFNHVSMEGIQYV